MSWARRSAQAVQSAQASARVGILASGGLSHFTVDEELDRGVLDACKRNDGEALASLPVEKLNSGNSEIRNWITVGRRRRAFEKCLAGIHPVLPLGRGHRLRHGFRVVEIAHDPEKHPD